MAPGGSAKLAEEREAVRQLLQTIHGYLSAARTKDHTRELEARIEEIKRIDTTQRSLLSKVFGPALSPEAMQRIHTLRAQQPKTTTESYLELRRFRLPATAELELLEQKLTAYERLLGRSIGPALQREAAREQSAEASRLSREAKAEQRAREDARIRGMAAAHAAKTRRLAQAVRRKIEAQSLLVGGCPYCGEALGASPEADHIYPVSHGGLSTEHNMVFVCKPCNTKKGQMTLREFAKSQSLSLQIIELRLEALAKRF